ncbi:MAG: thiamine diphosphokinase [Oscillospiraceae bacterium]|nr:thiamine diphosphokinase [Oscillospiraceae bacterium]
MEETTPMQKICCIFGAGEFDPASIQLPENRFIIAADGGYNTLVSLGLCPDLLLGDFDSLDSSDLPAGIETIRHPAQKDDTDMMLAAREGLSRGFDAFHIHGGAGGRLDHTLANLHVLSYLAERGAAGFLFHRDCVITAVRDGTLCFPAGYGGTVSVFCHGENARGVSLAELRYPLNGAELDMSFPLGVSNEFTGAPASVRVGQGTLIVIWADTTQKELPSFVKNKQNI